MGIEPSYKVTCDRCQQEALHGSISISHLKKRLAKDGWRQRSGYGILCSNCVKTLKEMLPIERQKDFANMRAHRTLMQENAPFLWRRQQ